MRVSSRAQTALSAGMLPEWVKRFTVAEMEDASGTPALVVSLFIDTDHLEDGAAMNELAAKIHAALIEADIAEWPYVRFEDASEAA